MMSAAHRLAVMGGLVQAGLDVVLEQVNKIYSVEAEVTGLELNALKIYQATLFD